MTRPLHKHPIVRDVSDLRLLLDAPGDIRTRIQIAQLGDFKHARYGDFSVTESNVANWTKNLAHLPGGRAPIDLDHSANRLPRKTEAAGWITGIDMADGVPMADVEWTPVGEQAIRDKRYLFFSPTYGKFEDEHGTVHDDTLVGGGLTNKPHFSKLPTLSLAAPERMVEAYERIYDNDLTELDVDADERKLALKEGNSLPDGSYPIRNTAQLHAAAILAASGHGDVQGARKLITRRAKELGVQLTSLPGFGSDSPAKNMDTAILTLLDLDESADEAKVLEAITALKTPPAAEPVKTLEQQAADAGMVVLDSAQLTQLTSDAAAGREAKDELHANRFENAWTKALDAGRATPAMEETKRALYAVAPDLTIKELDEGPTIINVKPSGWKNDKDAPGAQTSPPGVEPENYALDQKIWAYIRENKLPNTDYPLVLDQAFRGQINFEGSN